MANRILRLDPNVRASTGGSLALTEAIYLEGPPVVTAPPFSVFLRFRLPETQPEGPFVLWSATDSTLGPLVTGYFVSIESDGVIQAIAYKDSTYTASAKTANAVQWGQTNTILATFDSTGLRTVTLNDGARASNAVTMAPVGIDNHVLNGTLSSTGHNHGQAWEPGTLALFSAAVDEAGYDWLHDDGLGRRRDDLPSGLAAALLDWWTFGGPATVHGGAKRTGLLVPVGGTPTRGGPVSCDAWEAADDTPLVALTDPDSGLTTTFAPDATATYVESPRAITLGPATSGTIPGRVASGRTAFTLAVPAEVRSDNGTDRCLWAEVTDDGSGCRLLLKAGGLLSWQYLAAGGAVSAEVTATERVHGSATIGAEATSTPVESDTRSRLHIPIGIGHAFAEGDRVKLIGAGTYYDALELSVSHSRPDLGWIRVVVDDGAAPAPTEGGTVAGVGAYHCSLDGSDDQLATRPRRVVLRVDRSGDEVRLFARNRQVGGGTIPGLPAGPSSGVTTYLGTHPGSGLSAADATLGPIEVWDGRLEGRDADALEVRLGVKNNRTTFELFSRVMFRFDEVGILDRTGVAQYPIEVVFYDAVTGELADDWIDPFSGQSISRATGATITRVLGSKDQATTQRWVAHATIWDRPYNDDGTPRARSVLYSGPIAEIEARPPGEHWETLHVSSSDPAANNSNAGTDPAAPLATIREAQQRSGPYTRILLKAGDTFNEGHVWATGGDPTSISFGMAEHAWNGQTKVGPIVLATYGTGHATWTGQAGCLYVLAGCLDIRVEGLHWEDAVYGSLIGLEACRELTFRDVQVESVPDAGTIEVTPGFTPTGPSFVVNQMGGGVRGLAVDTGRWATGPDAATYGITFNFAVQDVAVLRWQDDGFTSGPGAHPARVPNPDGLEFGHWVKRSAAQDSYFHGYDLRTGWRMVSCHDLPNNGEGSGTINRQVRGDASIGLLGPNVSSRLERIEAQWCAPPPHADLALVQIRAVDSPINTSYAVTEESRHVERCQVAIGLRDPASVWRPGLMIDPLTGPHANAVSATGDFGTLVAPDIEHHTAIDGTVCLMAEGPPRGGQGFAHLRLQRRPAGSGTFEDVPGCAAYYATDAPGVGEWEYRFRTFDAAAAEATGTAVTVTVEEGDMPIVEADILYKLSIKTGTAGNQSAQPDPNASLGKYISTSTIPDATSNNLFDDVSGDENAALDVEYRCLFVHNDHATLTLQSAVCWISAAVAGGADFAIGLDPAGVVPIGQAGAQAAEVADESTAPAGVTFSAPTTKGGGLAIGDIGPDECQAIWVRRTATNSSAIDDDGITIRVEGDTSA